MTSYRKYIVTQKFLNCAYLVNVLNECRHEKEFLVAVMQGEWKIWLYPGYLVELWSEEF
jgi:hypothetical protein